MSINWSIQVPGLGGLLIPTYGNYGGPGYSDGEILDDPMQDVDYSEEPVDALDALFLAHDQVYDSPSLEVRAEGDLALAEGIVALPDEQLDAQASLYGGLAILFAIHQIVLVNKQPDLLSPVEYLSLVQHALEDVERGLSQASPIELAAIVNWLEESAGVDIDLSTDALVDAGQVFDFAQLAPEASGPIVSADFAGGAPDAVQDGFAALRASAIHESTAIENALADSPYLAAKYADLFG